MKSYELKDGTVIKVEIGTQNFSEGTVPVHLENGDLIHAKMFNDDGDIGFTIKDEYVLFHWMK